MLTHDGVDFFDIDMLAHRVGQQIELAGFILRIFDIAIQRRQPFTLAQAVNQRAGKFIAIKQAVQIGAKRQAVITDRAVRYAPPLPPATPAALERGSPSPGWSFCCAQSG